MSPDPVTPSGTRLLVVNRHAYLTQPMLDMIDGSHFMKRAGAHDVVEIDVLFSKGSDEPCDFLVGRACGLLFLGGPLPAPVASELVLAERVDLDQFVVERYVTSEPLDLRPADLLLPQERSGLVLEFGGHDPSG